MIRISISVVLLMFCSYLTHAQNSLTFNISTDCWGGEVSWNIVDDQGTTVSSNEQAYGNQTDYTQAIDLPDGCYTFTINDSYGDGMNGSQWGSCTVDGTYNITDDQGNIVIELLAANSNYGDSEVQLFTLPTNGGGNAGCTDPNADNYDGCATSDDGSCTYPSPTAEFTVEGGSCPGSAVTLTAVTSDLVDSWSWDLTGSDQGTASGQSTTVTYSTAGTYTITLTATDPYGGTAMSSQDFTVVDGLELVIDIVQDNYPQETSWDLVNENGDQIASGDVNGATVCIADECHTFTIYDSYGDGICCGYGDGSFTLTLEGQTIGTGGQFGDSQSISFNCAPGFDCNNAIDVAIGEHTTPFANAWYRFTPENNGQYRITTCNRSTCDTKIWLYDYCNMQLFDDTQESALTYNDDNCGVQAEITPLMAAGTEYYIRIGDTDNACGGGELGFAIEYMGQVQGCMDQAACNYLPIAEIPDTCYFPGDPECPNIGPDLEILGDVFYDSMYATTLNNADECYINEGCLAGFGDVRLFDLQLTLRTSVLRITSSVIQQINQINLNLMLVTITGTTRVMLSM
ncbi:MAG: PKD domain-containing protein [Flavobacteriales bacterium]|nr:PKD domain-containing protein [Flavobacteriales bacterium]